MKKSKSLEIRLSEEELSTWKAEAKRHGLALSEYIRRRVALKPLTARKRRYSEVQAEKEAQEQDVSQPSTREDDLEVNPNPSPEELAKWAKEDPILAAEIAKEETREAAWQDRLESERLVAQVRDRRFKANGLAYRASGATRWYASMTPEQHAEWDDLKETMLESERMARAAGNQAEWQQPEPQPVITQAQPAPSQPPANGDKLWEALVLERLRRKSQKYIP